MLLLAVIFLVTVYKLKAGPVLDEAAAREKLKQGAILVDVRTVAEFQAKHLTNAINIPLDELEKKLPLQVTNQSQVILLHCLSGRRSGMAENQLHSMGYTNAYNLGSYQKAEKIVGGETP